MVGSIADRHFVKRCMRGVDAVIHEDVYAARGWTMFPTIDRVYVNERARNELGWQPRYDFAHVVKRVANGDDFRSALARAIGSKGYHDVVVDDGP